MKTILHLITSLKTGGTEKYVEDIVTIDKEKYKHIVAYIKEFGETGQSIRNAGVQVIRLSSFLKIIKYIYKIKPDIIHTHLYRANILGRIAGRLAKTTVVSSRQSTDTWRKGRHKLAEKFTSRFCSAIIVNSENVKDLIIEEGVVRPEKIKVIYIGIGNEWFQDISGKKSEGKAIGFVGRLHPEKGADLIPKFAEKISHADKNIKIRIAGGGELQNYLKERLPNNSELLGWKSGKELIEFYDSVDLLFMLSRMESIPRVIIEAGARKLPTVAPDLGGISEIINDGINGFLYPPGNLDIAVKKIERYFGDRDPSLSKNIYKTSHQFKARKTVKETLQVYDVVTVV